MSPHPQATPERVIALVAATLGDTDEYGRVEIDLAGNRDAYARIVDTLDALAWLTPECVRRYQRNSASTPWERITVGSIQISGPLGFTPASDRFGLTREEPIRRLAAVPPVLASPERRMQLRREALARVPEDAA